jgi:hypothetical protein
MSDTQPAAKAGRQKKEGGKQSALKTALDTLVQDGTITLVQAGAVRKALRDVRKSSGEADTED